MVNNDAALDLVFGALVSPVRRAILVRLQEAPTLSVSDLARPLAVKLPAVLKHLSVLETASLITRAKEGRTMWVRLAPAPMAEATAWMLRYEQFWAGSLDRLVAYAEQKERQQQHAAKRART